MRRLGPPTLASGTAFFEYFLPMMAILGDIIEVHQRRRHPRLGAQQDGHSVGVLQGLLASYELSLASLATDAPVSSPLSSLGTPVHANRDVVTGLSTPAPYQEGMRMTHDAADQTKVRLVKAYSTHILHVLHVLLHGKWDAISMLDDGDDWITSKRFTECAAHAISASQSVSTILALDPELTFMSYLFGIYLLQGSFILLLFADRMPQLGPNESVEQACENIIRAHEVCVVTLSTDFQVRSRVPWSSWGKNLMRSSEKLPQGRTIYPVQRSGIRHDQLGGAPSKTQSAVAVPVDKGGQGSGLVMRWIHDDVCGVMLKPVLLATGTDS